MWAWIAAIAIVLALHAAYIPLKRLQYGHIPGPAPLPYFGHILLLKGQGLYEVHTKLSKLYGRMFLFFLGGQPVVVVSDHKLVREVSCEKFKQFHDRPVPSIVTTAKRFAAVVSGILLAPGKLWISLRAASQPLFHADSLEHHGEAMNAAANMLVAAIDKSAESGDAFDFCQLAGKLTMRVIFNCAFGVDVDTQSDGSEHPAITASKVFFQPAGLGNFWNVFILSLPQALRPAATRVAYNLSKLRDMEGSRDALFSITNQLAKSYCEAEGLPPFEADPELLGRGRNLQLLPPGTTPSKHSVIACMMRATNRDTGARLEPEQVLQQGSVFMIAGYETTATAISFALYLLAQHPDAEAKLLQEIDAQGRDRTPTYDSLKDWPYAKACFQEALRLFPIAPLTNRLCVESTTLGGVKVPRGTVVHINIMQIHHDEANFEEPEAFRPERFVATESTKSADQNPAFMPFGVGPHNCIGWRFAMEEGMIVLIRLYQKYIFRLSEVHHQPGASLALRKSITISPKDGIWVKAIPR